MCQVAAVISKRTGAFAGNVYGTFKVFVQLLKARYFATGLLYNCLIIFGSSTQPGRLFCCLHKKDFLNPEYTKPLYSWSDLQTTEGLVQH